MTIPLSVLLGFAGGERWYSAGISHHRNEGPRRYRTGNREGGARGLEAADHIRGPRRDAPSNPTQEGASS